MPPRGTGYDRGMVSTARALTVRPDRPAARWVSRRGLLLLTGLGSMSLLAACGGDDRPEGASAPAEGAGGEVDPARLAFTVHKDPTCGCCDGWVEHAEGHGFSITVEHPDSLEDVWSRHDISRDLQSCHLAVNPDGDVFVGHVAARFVLEYLADPPQGARGLSVPAMPTGTPGMEQGDQLDAYDVLLLTEGGSRVFATVTEPSQQQLRA